MNRRLFLGMFLGALGQIFAVGLLLCSAWLIVRASEAPPVLYLMVAIVSVRFFGIGRSVLRYVERLIVHDVALHRSTVERVAAYRELVRLVPGGLGRRRQGDVVDSVISDVELVQDGLVRLKLPWFTTLPACAVVVLTAGLIAPWAGVVLAVGSAATLLLIRFAVPNLAARRGAAEAALRGEYAAEVTELVQAAPDLVVYGVSGEQSVRALGNVAALAERQRRGAWSGGFGSAAVLAIAGVNAASLALIVHGAGLAGPWAAVVLLAPLAMIEPFDALAEAEARRPVIEQARARLDEFRALPNPIGEPGAPQFPPADPTLAVHDLTIGWDTGLVEGLNFRVGVGDVLAVAGPSGSGKSTLAATLVRFLEPLGGRITLGGADATLLDPEQVRQIVGVLGQEEFVFDTTIRENLRIAAPEASEEAMRQALRRAGLADLIDRLEHGIDTELGVAGSRLSGGERRRLALARVLLGGHQIIVLDEPTEHLDEPTARALMRDLLALREDHGLIVISHSPWVVGACDERIDLPAHKIAVCPPLIYS